MAKKVSELFEVLSCPLDLFIFVLFFVFCFLFCFVLFCFVLFCFVLFCFVLFCFVLAFSFFSWDKIYKTKKKNLRIRANIELNFARV
jgi:hypothetical protein